MTVTTPGDLYGYGKEPDPSFAAIEPDAVAEGRVVHHKAVKKTTVDYDIRCAGKRADPNYAGQMVTCGKLLAECAGRPWRLRCARCKKVNRSAAED